MTAGPKATVVLVAMLVAQTIVSTAALTLPVLAPTLSQVLHVSASLVGYQMSVVYASAMVSAALGGSIVARLGACRTTQAVLAFIGAGVLLFAVVPDLAALVVGSVLLGLGYGASNPASAHLLTRYTPASSRNLIFSIKQTGVPLGGMAAALVIPVVEYAYGWRIAIIVVFASALALFLILQPARARWDDEHPTLPRTTAVALGGINLVWVRRDLRYLALMALCFAGVQLCVVTFTVTFLVSEARYTLIEAGVLLSAVEFAGAVGRVGWGWIADQMHASKTVLFALGMLMLALTVAVTQVNPQQSPLAIAVILVMLGATAIGWNGVFLAEVAHLAPAGQVSAATGGALFFTFGGVLIVPSLFAVVYGRVESYGDAFGVAAVFALLGMMSLWRAQSLARKQEKAV